MEKLAHNLAEKIALQMHFDEDKKAVIAYGLTAIFQIITLLISISIIGIIFGFWYESIILFLGVGVIRKSTGGAHSNTIYGCILISILSIALLSSLSRYILNFSIGIFLNLGITALIFIVGFFIFYYRVPVASPKKPIIKPDKIKKLRRQSFVILFVFLIITIALILFAGSNERFYSLAVSVRLAVVWQFFTLTKIGARFIDKIDLKNIPRME